MILIISQSDDGPAAQVAQRLQERGAEVFWFDPAEYPERAEISLSYRGTGVTGVLRRGSEALALERIQVGWFRRPGWPVAPGHVQDEATRRFIEEDCRSFINNLWDALPCQWVPGPFPRLFQAEHKLAQLRLAQTLGFEVPDTLVSNGPSEFLDFYRDQGGQVVSKLLGWGLEFHFKPFARYTQFVTPREEAWFQTHREELDELSTATVRHEDAPWLRSPHGLPGRAVRGMVGGAAPTGAHRMVLGAGELHAGALLTSSARPAAPSSAQ